MAYARGKRIPAPRRSAPEMKDKAFVAPTGGWVSAANLAAAPKGTAQVCENFFPTVTGLAQRGGTQKKGRASASSRVESAFAYIGTARKMFAASSGGIFNLTAPADPNVAPTADVTGQTSDYYSALNFATPGGQFMSVVNGTDPMLSYNGTTFYPITGTALSALNYDAETVTFVNGGTLTGGTSGATATMVKVIDNGTTGTLWIRVIAGTFQDNEIITGSLGGSATANGVISTLAPAITGVNTSGLSQVNAYRNRQWFVEGGTMNAHYLPVDSIGGALGSLSLAGVFKRGGALVFSATWSMDAGDGLDDKIVFASTEGEYAVYQGDPASVFGLVGRYDAAPPLGKNAFLQVGGDLLVLTEIGIVPMSKIQVKDPAALAITAISKNIGPDWVIDAKARRLLPWEIVKWPSRNVAIVSCPVIDNEVATPAFCYAVNLDTGAWSKWTNLDTQCLVLHDDFVYFGRRNGTLIQMQIGGNDEGQPIEYTYVGQNEHIAGVGVYTTVSQARAIFKIKSEINPQLSTSPDYVIELPSPPNAPVITTVSSNWDEGLWDVAQFDDGGEYVRYDTGWVSIGISGFVHAPQLQMTSSGTRLPTAELIMFEVTHLPGGVVV